MWASIERAHERGIPFKDMPRIFKLARSAFLRLTRSNVAKTENYALSEWKPQKYFIMDEGVARNNTKCIADYRSNHEMEMVLEQHNRVQVHAVLKNQYYHEVFTELLSKLSYLDNEVLSKSYFSLLDEALDKLHLNPLVDIYWVRDVEHSTRKISDKGEIQQLFQGRNPNVSSQFYYEGDRSLADKYPDHIQLQIHFVKPTNIPGIDFYAPALALFVPDSCSQELSKMVVRANG